MISFSDKLYEAEKQLPASLALSGLGGFELSIAASYTTSLFWSFQDADGIQKEEGGSMFLLDTGERIFAVTAAHVIEGYLETANSKTIISCIVASRFGTFISIDIKSRLIDFDREVDIATFWMTPEEIQQIKLEALRGSSQKWPPPLPFLQQSVTFCGFPGNGRRWITPHEIRVGCLAIGGVVSNSTETSVSFLIERERLFQVIGNQLMPKNYDFGGISGGPVITIVQTNTLRLWRPAGVIFQGPNPSAISGESISDVEIIKARPIHFVKSDGSIDVTRWQESNF